MHLGAPLVCVYFEILLLYQYVATHIPGEHERHKSKCEEECFLEAPCLGLVRLWLVQSQYNQIDDECIIVEEADADPSEHVGLAVNGECKSVCVRNVVTPLLFEVDDIHAAIDDEHDGADKHEQINALGSSSILAVVSGHLFLYI